ncbi:MAG: hypothetical protein R2683_01670 [Bifidobacterium adolescentis]
MTGFGQKKSMKPKPSSMRAPRKAIQVADAVAKIAALRQSIDEISTAIVSLLAERWKYTSQWVC